MATCWTMPNGPAALAELAAARFPSLLWPRTVLVVFGAGGTGFLEIPSQEPVWAATVSDARVAALVGLVTAPDAAARSRLTETASEMRERIRLIDVLLVTAGRWWSLACSDRTCCGTDGSPLSAPGA